MKNIINKTIFLLLAMFLPINFAFSQQSGKELFELGKEQFKKQQYDKAIESFNSALKLDNSLKEANFYLTLSFAKSGKYKKQAEQLIKETNESPEFSLMQGINSLANKHYDNALAYFLDAQKKGLNTPALNSNLGIAFYHNNQYNKAIECFEKSLAEQPNNPNAMFYNTLAYAKSGKYEKGAENLRKESENSSNYAYFEGIQMLESGLAGNAISQFQLALERNPQNSDAQMALGIAYSEMGKFSEALAAFDKASEMQSGFGFAAKTNDVMNNYYKRIAKSQTTDLQGRTMLHIAAERGDINTVKALLENGIDKSIKDNNGKTAADYAKDNSIKELLK